VVDEQAVRSAVEQIEDPELHRPLGTLGTIRAVTVATDGSVRVRLALAVPDSPARERLEADVAAAVTAVAGGGDVAVEFVPMSEGEREALGAQLRGGPDGKVTVGGPGSRTRVVAVGSGKGGVGKSSVTVNLGVALARRGRTVGILDADVWGFSIPRMMGADRPPTVLGNLLLPPELYGVRVISMDFFVRPGQAVIWRGPMLHKAIEQFLSDVYWDDPDYLLIDMPPGTGDVAISMSQFLPRAETIIVTTPQPTAQRVAARAGLMARQVDQEILGVVENMSWFTGDDGKRYTIFGEGGGAALAAELQVPLLGRVPLVPVLRESADQGLPVVVADPDGEAAAAFAHLAEEVENRRPRIRTHPELVIR